MSKNEADLYRIIQLTHEIESTYGDGRSFTIVARKQGAYTGPESEARSRDDRRWQDVAREWTKTRIPLIAELRAMVAKNRSAIPDLADLVEKHNWNSSSPPLNLFAKLRNAVQGAADELNTSKDSRTSRSGSDGSEAILLSDGSELVDPVPVAKIIAVVGREAGRSDKLAQKMIRRNYRLVKKANKWHCQRSDALAMFPNLSHKQRIEGI